MAHIHEAKRHSEINGEENVGDNKKRQSKERRNKKNEDQRYSNRSKEPQIELGIWQEKMTIDGRKGRRSGNQEQDEEIMVDSESGGETDSLEDGK